MSIASWDSPDLDVLYSNCFDVNRSMLQTIIRKSVHDRHDDSVTVRGPDIKIEMGTISTLFEPPQSLHLCRSRQPLPMSPSLWLAERAGSFTDGLARPRLYEIRNALFRRRYATEWGIQMLDIEGLIEDSFTHSRPIRRHGTIVEWIEVLPIVLHEIQQGRYKRCFVQEVEPTVTDPTYYAAADDWAHIFLHNPSTRERFRHCFEMSDGRRSLHNHRLKKLQNAEFLKAFFDVDTRVKAAHDVSRNTFIAILESALHKWECDGDATGTPGLYEGETQAAQSCLKAIIKQDYSCYFDGPNSRPITYGYQFDNADASELMSAMRVLFSKVLLIEGELVRSTSNGSVMTNIKGIAATPARNENESYNRDTASSSGPPQPDPEVHVPRLNSASNKWLAASSVASAANIGIDTLRKYRNAGRKGATGLVGIDKDGRQWRKQKQNSRTVWYLKCSISG